MNGNGFPPKNLFPVMYTPANLIQSLNRRIINQGIQQHTSQFSQFSLYPFSLNLPDR